VTPKCPGTDTGGKLLVAGAFMPGLFLFIVAGRSKMGTTFISTTKRFWSENAGIARTTRSG